MNDLIRLHDEGKADPFQTSSKPDEELFDVEKCEYLHPMIPTEVIN
jgi:hypothetical protein